MNLETDFFCQFIYVKFVCQLWESYLKKAPNAEKFFNKKKNSNLEN